ncbi:uncharacterized protein BJ171DRAFT_560888 [Polychytrium aggregatum]|uniref:uncharacterized protein n=1 Tax=Polychytrium aggregatum TaxID=110093 RepID=UPI0022FEC095|nr:uncharacterized protein BJ171DRAFT_560888 [Polychytrium aggregatum]KAI9209555.1 hypothetical protein BJ171DRAFT_560888 [Polychytrium aggregatum]
MDTILERQRHAHEEIERLEAAMVQELVEPGKTHKEKLQTEHRVLKLLERSQDKSAELLKLYEDEHGLGKAELQAIAGSNEFAEFYERLKTIKDYHRKYPNEIVEPMELSFRNIHNPEQEDEEMEVLFSGEEGMGRYLDLHQLYDIYINLKGIEKLSYRKYLDIFGDFTFLPKEAKSTPTYASYVSKMQLYLESFFQRSRPLFNLQQVYKDTITSFNEQWDQDTVFDGWEGILKHEDDEEADECYCVPCAKQFAKKTIFDAHLTGKKHKKAAEKLLQNGVTDVSPDERKKSREEAAKARKETLRPVILAETVVKAYALELLPYIDDTKANVERKQSLTDEERARQMDDEAEEVDQSESEDENEDKIYNPLKLPLGWDGKPIPFWLYKLHGLGIKYSCQICGDFVYMGRKAFDKHFQEWRHAHGMRSLGIPNTRQFHEITNIDDAIALHERLKKHTKTQDFKAEAMEEFEDGEGNVLNRKLFEDLKRQGLL